MSTHITREPSITTTARTCAYLAELIRKDVVDRRRDRTVLADEQAEDLAKIGLFGHAYANRKWPTIVATATIPPLPPPLPSVTDRAHLRHHGPNPVTTDQYGTLTFWAIAGAGEPTARSAQRGNRDGAWLWPALSHLGAGHRDPLPRQRPGSKGQGHRYHQDTVAGIAADLDHDALR
jgi:hypothetical protein